MSQADRTKWDARYAADAYSSRPHPSDFLRQQIALLPPGRALDVACGSGRNALFLAARGYAVDAVDISAVALERGADAAAAAGVDIAWHCQDLVESPRIPRDDYQLIVMFRFIAPALLRRLPAHLAPGGMLMVEEHLLWHKPVAGPTSSRFRVEGGALRALFPELALIVAADGEVIEPDGSLAALSRLLVKKPG